MRRLLFAMALLLAACTGASTASTPPPDPTAPIPAVTNPPPPTEPQERCFPDDAGPDEFVAGGVVGTAGGPGGDARVISDIRLGSPRPRPGDAAARCERLVVGLATSDGAPATSVGLTGVELLARQGILRISLPQVVDETATADTLLEGHLVQRVYVVADGEGRLTVDALLGAAVGAAVAPGRRGSIIVDLVRLGDPVEAPPAVGADAVVLLPDALDVSYPITVFGYGRSTAASLEVTLTGTDRAATAEVTVPAYPWGWFEVEFPDGPTGTIGLEVGGVAQPLRVG